jgi:hypothetical protein
MCTPLIVGPFSFDANTATGAIYLDKLDSFCFPKPDETDNPDIMFQQNSVPPYYSTVVRDALNYKFPDR